MKLTKPLGQKALVAIDSQIGRPHHLTMAVHRNPPKHTEDSIERLAFSMHECAIALGLSPGKIRLMVEAGELPAVHAGRRRLIPRESLQAFLNPSGTLADRCSE